MKPGRELDRLIAEKVIGDTVCQCVKPHLAFGHNEYCFGCKRGTCARYSTNIEAAWGLVEKLQPKFDLWREVDGEWFCQAYDNELRMENASGETAPHAICLAALKIERGKTNEPG